MSVFVFLVVFFAAGLVSHIIGAGPIFDIWTLCAVVVGLGFIASGSFREEITPILVGIGLLPPDEINPIVKKAIGKALIFLMASGPLSFSPKYRFWIYRKSLS